MPLRPWLPRRTSRQRPRQRGEPDGNAAAPHSVSPRPETPCVQAGLSQKARRDANRPKAIAHVLRAFQNKTRRASSDRNSWARRTICLRRCCFERISNQQSDVQQRLPHAPKRTNLPGVREPPTPVGETIVRVFAAADATARKPSRYRAEKTLFRHGKSKRPMSGHGSREPQHSRPPLVPGWTSIPAHGRAWVAKTRPERAAPAWSHAPSESENSRRSNNHRTWPEPAKPGQPTTPRQRRTRTPPKQWAGGKASYAGSEKS